ncbi:hypothetical protein MC7420_4203 [Coleofasciculus chthonoplastes PCC 7420]|uniref:Uncharacterized protein n=1 Tax=Coleofasciculus chthonoplastes PCC 7420 TaxID=118168 RepID=B4VV46_9CYAN|nr:hypothetical protein MC7420_4203 [Coleofasciculus chthonoplastes PCC 7420]
MDKPRDLILSILLGQSRKNKGALNFGQVNLYLSGNIKVGWGLDTLYRWKPHSHFVT